MNAAGGRRAVVIGGGIAGLASAALLAEEGFAVTLLEARDEVGGRAGEWHRDGFRFETGPSWYLMPEVFDHFFRLLGTTADAELDLTGLDPGYRVVFEPDGGDAESVDVGASRAANVALAERLEPGSAPRLERYLDSAGWVYETAKRRFLYTTFARLTPLLTPDVLRGLPRLVPMLLESLHTYVTRRFRDPRLAQILQYPAVFLGSSPYATPGMYHLMSSLDLEGGVLYPRGGISALIAAVRRQAEQRSVTIRTGTAATRIETTGRVGGPVRATGVRTSAGDVVPADVVVSAMDLAASERMLLPPALRTYPPEWWARRTPGPSAVLVLLGVRGALPELLHHTLFFTRDWRRNFAAVMPKRGRPAPPLPDELSLYVCRPSATDAVAPEGHENLFVLVPVPADPTLGHGGEDGAGSAVVEAIADAAIDQIAAWSGATDLRERIVVRRTIGPADFADDLNAWRGTALGPAHTLAQSALFRAGDVSRHVDGLYYAGGSTIPGIGLPMCVISAELVIKRLRGDTSTGPLPEPL